MSDAWLDLTRGLLLRSILFAPEARSSDKNRFQFFKENSTIEDVIDSFEKAFPGFKHSIDPKSGVLWIYPENRQLDQLWPQQVKTKYSAPAVPMLSGVLENLTRLLPSQFYSAPFGAFAYATLNLPVDVQEGSCSVEEMLNVCLTDNPGDAFYISDIGRGRLWVQGVDVGYRNIDDPAGTAVYFWHKAIGSTTGPIPSPQEIVKALASENLIIKHRARAYMQMNQRTKSWNLVADAAKNSQESLWVAVANESVHARADGVGNLQFIQVLHRVVNSTNSLPPGLQILGALVEQQADWRQSADLERVAKMKATENDLAPVKYDMIRVLRVSQQARMKVVELAPLWSGFSKSEIEALGRADSLFSLP